MSDRDELNRDIGSTVHALMVKQRVTGKEIAGLLGLEPPSLSDRLHGKVAFRADELARISACLSVPVERFFDGLGSIHSKSAIWLVEPATGQLDLPFEEEVDRYVWGRDLALTH